MQSQTVGRKMVQKKGGGQKDGLDTRGWTEGTGDRKKMRTGVGDGQKEEERVDRKRGVDGRGMSRRTERGEKG